MGAEDDEGRGGLRVMSASKEISSSASESTAVRKAKESRRTRRESSMVRGGRAVQEKGRGEGKGRGTGGICRGEGGEDRGRDRRGGAQRGTGRGTKWGMRGEERVDAVRMGCDGMARRSGQQCEVM